VGQWPWGSDTCSRIDSKGSAVSKCRLCSREGGSYLNRCCYKGCGGCKLALFGKGLMCITACGEYFSSWEGNGGKI
jgi:hypothetical protein